MNQIKFQASVLFLFLFLGVGVYWAVSTLDHGVTYPQNVVVNAGEPLAIATNEVDQTIGEVVAVDPEPILEPETPTETQEPSPDNADHTELIAALNKLIDDKIFMKQGSYGTRVGTVQKALNVYFSNDQKTADNDYGPGTLARVRAYQKAEGLTADGQAGPNTYQSIIDWINKQ